MRNAIFMFRHTLDYFLNRGNRDNRGKARLYWSKRYPGDENTRGNAGVYRLTRMNLPRFSTYRGRTVVRFQPMFMRVTPAAPVIPVEKVMYCKNR
jgi:hypothetical protein